MLLKRVITWSALVRAALGLAVVGAVGLGESGPALAQSAAGPNLTQPASGWSAGPSASGTNTITGALDQPSSSAPAPVGGAFTVSGWAVDTTAPGWAGIDQVQVWNGLMGQGGAQLASASVALNRPDVAQALSYPFWAASGFVANVPASANTLPAGSASLNLYVHTPGGGWWYRSFTFPVGGAPTSGPAASTVSPGSQPVVVIEKPSAGENVGVVTQNNTNTISITGFAFDPNATPVEGSGIDQIQVYINGQRGSGSGGTLLGITSAGSADAQAAKQFGSRWTNSGWSVNFTPTSYPDGYTVIYVYAHSAVSRQWTTLKEGFNIVEGYGS